MQAPGGTALPPALEGPAAEPTAADQERARIGDVADRGLSPVLTFDPAEDVAAPFVATGPRPREAVLRDRCPRRRSDSSTAPTPAAVERQAVEPHDRTCTISRVTV